MTTDVVTLRETDDVAEAARLMLGHGYRSIPVVTGGRVVGIVARQDLLGVLARRDTEIRAELDELLGELLLALLQVVRPLGDLLVEPALALDQRLLGLVAGSFSLGAAVLHRRRGLPGRP